jgi:hypothetical protein
MPAASFETAVNEHVKTWRFEAGIDNLQASSSSFFFFWGVELAHVGSQASLHFLTNDCDYYARIGNAKAGIGLDAMRRASAGDR